MVRKFTSICEGVRLGSLSLSDAEFGEYKRFIMRTLYELHGDKIIDVTPVGGITQRMIKCLDSELATEPGRVYSILNKVNTNTTLAGALVNRYRSKSLSELLGSIELDKGKLFMDGTTEFAWIRSIIRATEMKGEKIEDLVCEYIKKVISVKLGIEVNPIREPTASPRDLFEKIDISFFIGEKEYTCQVKPFVDMREGKDIYHVMSSGKLGPVNTDYLAFGNVATNTVYLFRNRKVKYTSNIVDIDKSSLVRIEPTMNQEIVTRD